MKMGNPSAVAIIETPNSFILEGRPKATEGQELAHPGKDQFFGGSIEPGEDDETAARRELWEEVDLDPKELVLDRVWTGIYQNSQNRRGERVARHVSLFRAAIDSVAQLTLKVPGSIVEIPNTLDAVEAHRDRLTPFAYFGLKMILQGANHNGTQHN